MSAYSGDIGGFGAGGGTGYYNPTTGGHNTGGGSSSGSSPSTPSVSLTSLFGGGGSGWGTLFNLIGAGASAYGAYKSYEQGKNLAEAFTTSSRRISKLQEQSQAEQRAEQAARSAGERRQQIREERVKRSRIMQASQNTGVGGSSGEAGALSSASTQLGANVGFNLGAIQSANNITGLNQAIADTSSAYQEQANAPNNFNAISQLGTSLFGGTGGFNTLSSIFK